MADFLPRVPAHLLHNIEGTKCPITFRFMADPVVLRGTGYSYERAAITAHLATEWTDPMTGRLLSFDEQLLIPNPALKGLIDRIRARIASEETVIVID